MVNETNQELPVLGMDHIYLTVSSLNVSEKFYDTVMEILGFRKAKNYLAGDPHIHYFCRSYGFSLRPAKVKQLHSPYAPGLHHFCFRVSSEKSVNEVYENLLKEQLKATPPKLYPEYAPDYYATFFEDPDGIRLEVTNFREDRRAKFERWEPILKNP